MSLKTFLWIVWRKQFVQRLTAYVIQILRKRNVSKNKLKVLTSIEECDNLVEVI
jgi:hypothetical protein